VPPTAFEGPSSRYDGPQWFDLGLTPSTTGRNSRGSGGPARGHASITRRTAVDACNWLILQRTRVGSRGLDSRHPLHSSASVAARKLAMLDAAHTLDFLRSPPGNRLEQLRGDRKGQYSIRINDQFRICFRWTGDGPADVEIVDFH